MYRSKILLAAGILMFVTICLAVATSGLISANQSIPTGGTMSSSVGVEVYTDPDATKLCTYIDWGTVDEGETVTETVYVKNTGNATETLHLVVTDWEPALAGELLSLIWDKEETQLEPDAIVAATLTLAIPRDAQNLDSFNFNVVIEGTC